MTGARSLLVAALGALFLTAPAAGAEKDVRVVERKRVVVRIEAGTDRNEFSYAFVGHPDGEPVVLESRVTERGYAGLSLLDLTAELRAHFGAPENAGVMVSRVESGSPAASAGLAVGDVVIGVDGAVAGSATELVHRIAEGGEGDRLELLVLRDGRELDRSLTLDARPRRQLDLGGLLRVPRGERLPGIAVREGRIMPLIELDAESLERALSLLRAHLDSAGWQRQLELRGGDRRRLESRILEVERKLRELETELEDLPE